MKVLTLTVAASALLIAGTANAADMPAQAPAYARTYVNPTYDWSGGYIGAHAGYASSASDINDLFFYDTGGTQTLKANGFAGGGQFGFNVQSGHVVYGIEADASWLDLDHNSMGYYGVKSTKAEWMATVRGRLGLAIDRTLLYVTAGGAFSDIEATFNTDGFSDGGDVGSVSGKGKFGWTFGAGVEHAFADNWTFKLEGLYTRFTNEDTDLLDDPDGCTPADGGEQRCAFSFNHDIWAVRAGINYHFTGGPVVARY
jgi:outer membrane immunogenic protein